MVLTGIETVKVAVICTGHVSHKDSEIIPEFLWNNWKESGEFWISSTAHGWLFRLCALPYEWEERLKNFGVSDGCISNLRMLECEGYDWVHFQADAPIIEEPKHWDW